MISLSWYLTFAAAMFVIGLAGVILNRKNLITILMSVELMLLAVNTNFIAFSDFLNNGLGEVFVFFVLTVAAAEAAIGLAIVIAIFRQRQSIDVEDLDLLKG
jgi:NADH-quinone oxidoreductase subunit K